MGISPENFGDRLVELLPRLMREISRYENNYITSGKITCQQFLALEMLAARDEWQMNEFVEKTETSFSTATGMIDRLVNHGLANRVRGEADRRTVLVAVTAKGRKVLREVYAQKKEGIIQVFKRLSPQERQQYLDIIQKLVQQLSSAKGVAT